MSAEPVGGTGGDDEDETDARERHDRFVDAAGESRRVKRIERMDDAFAEGRGQRVVKRPEYS